MRFSERYGLKPVREVIQKDGIDGDLRNRLWNCVDVHLCRNLSDDAAEVRDLDGAYAVVLQRLWHVHFKVPLDTMQEYTFAVVSQIRKVFFECSWPDVYDLLEFLAQELPGPLAGNFANSCNAVLEEEQSGYRIVSGEVAPIVDENEIRAIEEAAKDTGNLPGVRAHLQTALVHLSDRKKPDYRNSVKESISAVEALARVITGKPKATLGDALKALGKSGEVEVHPALLQAFEKLYGYTSDEHGVRHAMTEEGKVGQAEALYMHVACSAFVSYLIAKAADARIKLT
jgi:uncharacterized protein with PIN domain